MIRTKLVALLMSTTALVALSPLTVHSQTLVTPKVSQPASEPALPSGGQVASGSVTMAPGSLGQLNIDQTSQSAIINWQDFSIGQGNTVRVTQPDATSALLNRVTGNTPSTIAGTLSANGRVYLINPNGITITASGKVEAAAFTASTLDLSDSDFTAGRFDFHGNGASAGVSNSGTISVISGGYVALLGGTVSNSGTILAPLGKVGLGSGEAVTLDLAGDGFLQVTVPTATGGSDALVGNSGQITANGGSVILSAATARDVVRQAVNMSGVIEANSVSGHNGSIRLSGGQGAVAVSGALKATSATGAGGDITVTGRDIAVTGATLDASGATAGGKILVLANGTTRANGTFAATGGVLGGTVETSGASIDFTGITVDTTAANGEAGTWLIDPSNLTVDAAAATTIATNLATTNVTLQTNADGTTSGPGNASAGAGDILINSGITWSSNKLLTLNAYHALQINAPITITGAGGLALNYDATNVMNLIFNGTGTVDYGAIDHGGTLSINGANYTLVYSMAQLDAIDGLNGVDNSSMPVYGLGRSGNYALATSLDASGTTYTQALITDTNFSLYFGGTFEGLGHTISNLNINSPVQHYVALFAVITGASIRDIGIVGGSFVGTNGVGSLVGVAYTANKISNVYSTAAVTGYNAGGLVHENDGTITNSYATGTVSGYQVGGGLVGSNHGVIINSFATGAVISTRTASDTFYGGQFGGLVGVHGQNGQILSSYATGNITGIAYLAGGLVGRNWSGGVITSSYALGNVTTTSYLNGGLVGSNDSIVNTSYSTGVVSGGQYNGGLIGENYTGSVTNSFWDKQSSGQSVGIGADGGGQSVNVHGLTTAQAMTQSSYVGWDFNLTWVMADGYTRPFLFSEHSDYITNAHQLQLMGMNLGGNYTLAKDIDTSATSGNPSGMWYGGFVPVGTLSNPYFGTFDGAGHTISGLKINAMSVSNAGLFGVIGTIGKVQNVALTNSFQTIPASAAYGTLAGINYGSINSSSSESYINPIYSSTPTGGLVGINYGVIADSHSAGSLSGSASVGGLVGINGSATQAGTIVRSYSNVDVSASLDLSNAGGLVGRNMNGSITQSFATGRISGRYNVGGLVGLNQAAISQSYSTSYVSGANQVGGLVGSADWYTATGHFSFSAIDQSYSTGMVTGTSNVGGIAGYNSQYTTITNSYWDTETSGRLIGIGLDNAGQVVTGLTTAQFQSGSLPSGLDGAVWGTSAGLYPYLKPIFTNGVQVVSGFLTKLDGTGFGGTPVTFVGNGIQLGTFSTGANGYYYLTLAAGTLSAGTNNLLAATSKTATLASATGAQIQTGVNLYHHNLTGTTTDMSLSTAVTDLKAAMLLAMGGNMPLTQYVNEADGLRLDYAGAGTFTVDQVQDVTSELIIKAPNAGIAVNNAITVETGSTLSLLSGNSVAVNALLKVKGAGTVNLAASPATDANLVFGPGYNLTYAKTDGTAATSDQGGKLSIGGEAYTLLYSLSDLAGINYGTGRYALATSLDATGNTYSASLVGTLNGKFNGLGNGISHVTLNGADTFTGLFGILNPTGSVRNLSLNSSTVTGAGYSVGGLIGFNNGGALSNVKVNSLSLTGSGNSHVGGVAGYNTGAIDTASSSGSVSGSGQYIGIGGLVGWNAGGTVNNSASSVAVSGTADNAFDGGLVGVNNGGTLTNSTSSGSVTANGWAIGGLVGYNLGNLGGDSSSATVTGTGALSFVGGLAGVNNAGNTISNSSTSGTVSGTGFAFGGLVGYNFGTLSNDHTTGSVTGTGNAYVGGLAGFNLGTIDTAYATGAISSDGATSQIGGLIGQNFSGGVSNAYATGTVTGTGSNSFVGGLIGVNKASVSQSYASGNVSGSGYTVGGLVGWNEANMSQVKYTTGTVTGGANAHAGGLVGYNLGTIDTAYVSGAVTSTGVNTGVGGVVGWQAAGSLSNAYATGSVTGGNAFIGGVAGVNFATINSAYAAGLVTGAGAFTGGLVGFNGGTITAGYYDYQTTGQAPGVQANGSQGVSTATLKSGLPAGFASVIWNSIAGSYPKLIFEP